MVVVGGDGPKSGASRTAPEKPGVPLAVLGRAATNNRSSECHAPNFRRIGRTT